MVMCVYALGLVPPVLRHADRPPVVLPICCSMGYRAVRSMMCLYVKRPPGLQCLNHRNGAEALRRLRMNYLSFVMQIPYGWQTWSCGVIILRVIRVKVKVTVVEMMMGRVKGV